MVHKIVVLAATLGMWSPVGLAQGTRFAFETNFACPSDAVWSHLCFIDTQRPPRFILPPTCVRA